ELCEALGQAPRANSLRQQASALAEHFHRAFWLADRAYYALALDGAKRPVDGLASNAGQALWSGVVPPQHAKVVAQRLLDQGRVSGWGVRPRGAAEGAYSPVGYHPGTVWPHDTPLIAAGLVRYGLQTEAARLIAAQLAATAELPDYRLPELFSGYARGEYG